MSLASPRPATRHAVGPRFSRAVALLLGLAALDAVWRAEPAPPSPRPNLLLVTIDTLRADHCSAYGYGKPTTPALDGLARRGLRFARAYAPMPLTAPSHASLMTGLYPHRHLVTDNTRVLSAGVPTLAEWLRRAGYSTAAVVSAYPLLPRYGLSRGYAHYEARFTERAASIVGAPVDGAPTHEPYDRRADATTALALEWLAQRPARRPFYLWVHYFDPHAPYAPPAPDDEWLRAATASEDAARIAAYDGEVRFADRQLARLLSWFEAQGLGAHTLVAVAADHGEGLFDHGEAEHGRTVYDEAMRVPLVLSWPGRIPAGSVEHAPVSLVDLVPTLLPLLGVRAEAEAFDGRSLWPLQRGRPPGPRPILIESGYVEGQPGHRGVVEGDWKYVRSRGRDEPHDLLFDLRRDPGERDNLAARDPGLAGRLWRRVRSLRSRAPVVPSPAAERPPAPDEVEALRSLGYVQ